MPCKQEFDTVVEGAAELKKCGQVMFDSWWQRMARCGSEGHGLFLLMLGVRNVILQGAARRRSLMGTR